MDPCFRSKQTHGIARLRRRLEFVPAVLLQAEHARSQAYPQYERRTRTPRSLTGDQAPIITSDYSRSTGQGTHAGHGIVLEEQLCCRARERCPARVKATLYVIVETSPDNHQVQVNAGKV